MKAGLRLSGEQGIELARPLHEAYMRGELPMVKPASEIQTWHGTPHDIEGNKFSNEKIGTGEGAQAYGMGHYTAEARGTGEKYRDTLSFVGAKDKSGEFYGKDGISFFFENALENSGIPSGAAKSQAQMWADKFVKGETINNPIAKQVIETKGLQPNVAGNLYKVDIPDELVAKYLDWDKPVGKEVIEKLTPENMGLKVKQFDNGLGYITEEGKLLHKITHTDPKKVNEESLKNSFMSTINDYSKSGQSLYGVLGGFGSNPEQTASKVLNNAGIPGIRYLDQGSRGKGGTSNFVTFDPETMKILEKNDVPIEQNKANGGMVKNKVQFTDNLDSMRHELTRNK
jgi:hypothetical protein